MQSLTTVRAVPPNRQFLIGKNSCGQWVVRDERGLCGGLFVNRNEALHFAMFENGNRPQAVVMVPEGLELKVSIPQACVTARLTADAANDR
jgi:hypothetical protein